MSTFRAYFGTWTQALKYAGLPARNYTNLSNTSNICEICGTSDTRKWCSKANLKVCENCGKTDRKFLHGKLDPSCATGVAVITEHIVYEVLGDCIKCNTIDDFYSNYDLISSKYGTINVKSSALRLNRLYSYRWEFGKGINSTAPDTYICIGFNETRLKIIRVWVIPNTSNVIANQGIFITNSDKSLSRAIQYEVDPEPYNKVYQNLDIYTLSEFRNYNKN